MDGQQQQQQDHAEEVEVKWSHSACSLEQLRQAFLLSKELLMQPIQVAIEVDVTWNPHFGCAVMRHAKESDETESDKEVMAVDWLKEFFFTHVPNHNSPHGIILKLDFKHGLSVQPVVEMVSKMILSTDGNQNEFGIVDRNRTNRTRVWLNADVLRGPGSGFGEFGIDPKFFLEKCKSMPGAALSLGWTTGFNHFSLFSSSTSSEDGVYSHAHVDAILGVCNDESLVHPIQELTFPIRASLIKESWQALERLVNMKSYKNPKRPRPTLTLWTGTEGVPESDLVWIREISKANNFNVYIDCDKGSRADWYSASRLAKNAYDGFSYFFGSS